MSSAAATAGGRGTYRDNPLITCNTSGPEMVQEQLSLTHQFLPEMVQEQLSLTHQFLQESLHALLELGAQLCCLQCCTLRGQLAKVEPGGQVGQGLQTSEYTVSHVAVAHSNMNA
jgi:hypothetical protein